MKEKDLKHRLQQTFDFSIWKEILPLFFKKIDYFSRPENVFPNDDKVIDGKQIGTVKLDDGKLLPNPPNITHIIKIIFSKIPTFLPKPFFSSPSTF
jgi:hypothetical protein